MLKSGSKYLSGIDEPTRIKVVKQFESLSLKYNRQLNQIVSDVAKIFKTPIALITLIDSETLWIKISKGLDVEQVPRNSSFSAYTIKHKSTFVIRDTFSDSRFMQNPNVLNEPKIRFYAGAPLITQAGACIGTLCAMDKKPLDCTNEQIMMLKILAQNVSNLMELKLTSDQLSNTLSDLKVVQKNKSQNEVKLRAMFESLTDAYVLLGKHGEILDFNKVAYQLIRKNYPTKLFLGRTMSGFLKPEYRDDFLLHFQNALTGTATNLEKQEGFVTEETGWWECRFEPVINDVGEIIGVSYSARDINERKLNEIRLFNQKQTLMKIAEIQSHEYRAPVATILGLMNLIENDRYVASAEYLRMLHTATKKLDEKIHEVVNMVNKTH